jgi:hypothetical protein
LRRAAERGGAEDETSAVVAGAAEWNCRDHELTPLSWGTDPLQTPL